jgi:hypothetical protein
LRFWVDAYRGDQVPFALGLSLERWLALGVAVAGAFGWRRAAFSPR